MELLTAFTAMLNDVGYANASARQIDGILDWSDYVSRAVRHADEMGASAGCMEVTFSGSATHRTWRISCMSILAALQSQAEEARVRRGDADAEDEEAGEDLDALMAWETAAADAHAFGEAVLRNEAPVARRVFDAIQAAGGLHEVPADKRYAATARGTR